MTEKRIHYRRFEDRRLAIMFAVHQLLFDMSPGKKRDERILAAIIDNFKVDRAAFVDLDIGPGSVARLGASAGDFRKARSGTAIAGKGIERLLRLHRDVVGALCLESVRKPEVFSQESWESLWSEGLGGSVRALMSVAIRPKKHPPKLIWLQQTSSSREWSSRDRDLIEELSHLLARALDKDG